MLPELPAALDAAITAVMPQTMLPDILRLEGSILQIEHTAFDLDRFENLYLCGSGKAALPMAEACEAILGTRIGGGVIVTPEAPRPLRYCEYVHSTHPLPSAESVAAADRLIECFEAATRNDLMLFLLSGGSSALIEKPLAPLTLEALVLTTKVLLDNGCSIAQTNAVRKHLSAIKGGRLAQRTRATVAVLVISDVIGDDLQTIGSAPLYCDSSTYAQTVAMLEAKALMPLLPETAVSVLRDGEKGAIAETPKHPPENVTHFIVGSNRRALDAAAEAAAAYGWNVKRIEEPLQGDVAAVAERFCKRFAALLPQTVLLQGGETTVTVTGGGRGGRNQHFALLCLQKLADKYAYDIFCVGTDGIDGNSDAAGARITTELYAKCEPDAIADALAHFDSNTFFKHVGAEVKTGYTGTNVMDIVIAYKGKDNG